MRKRYDPYLQHRLRCLAELGYEERQRRDGLLRRVLRVLCYLVVLGGAIFFILLLFTSCNTQDERDLCCEEVRVDYRYVRSQTDEYLEEIAQERRFLFDEQGLLLREIPVSPAHRQRLVLRGLPVGRYTIVTVGNASQEGSFLSDLQPGQTRLSGLLLGLRRKSEREAAYGPADQLFWSSLPIEARAQEKVRYIADMANIHCHLYLYVSWEMQPPKGDRSMGVELIGTADRYRLTEDLPRRLRVAGEGSAAKPLPPMEQWRSTPSFVFHGYPATVLPGTARVYAVQAMRGEELFAEVISLRYRDDLIPAVQLVHEGRPLFRKPIDLAPLFREWGWYPDRSWEQIYRIEMRILVDGRVEVRPYGEVSVLDWADGGVITG